MQHKRIRRDRELRRISAGNLLLGLGAGEVKLYSFVVGKINMESCRLVKVHTTGHNADPST